ncbi:hypothetical protein Trydic_g14048 [Trypoxylus dichotomus]
MKTEFGKLLGTNKTYVNKREYKLCLTAFLGHIPTDFELEILFDGNCSIPSAEVEKIIQRHILQKTDKEFEAMQIFRLFDCKSKGYINLNDVYRVWKDASPYLSWRHISECFNDVSVENKLHYDLFKAMYIADRE